jgi:DNA-binding response OmpR family regulator
VRLLIVEDDRQIAENLYDFLEGRGHDCDHAATAATARRLLADAPPDLLLLDRNLPDGDGLELARELRAAGQRLPILVLTALDTLDEKLAGFAAGVDDYLVKPFALQEVAARVDSLLRRALPAADEHAALTFGPLTFDPAAQLMRLDGAPLRLPPKALKLLAGLMRQPNRAVPRRELEHVVWGREQESSDNLRSVLLIVRKALDGSGVDITNLHGVGYRLERR